MLAGSLWEQELLSLTPNATEHSGQTSEPVSPVETNSATTGYSESNTEESVEQPNNNTPESDPVSDGAPEKQSVDDESKERTGASRG